MSEHHPSPSASPARAGAFCLTQPIGLALHFDFASAFLPHIAPYFSPSSLSFSPPSPAGPLLAANYRAALETRSRGWRAIHTATPFLPDTSPLECAAAHGDAENIALLVGAGARPQLACEVAAAVGRMDALQEGVALAIKGGFLRRQMTFGCDLASQGCAGGGGGGGKASVTVFMPDGTDVADAVVEFFAKVKGATAPRHTLDHPAAERALLLSLRAAVGAFCAPPLRRAWRRLGRRRRSVAAAAVAAAVARGGARATGAGSKQSAMQRAVRLLPYGALATLAPLPWLLLLLVAVYGLPPFAAACRRLKAVFTGAFAARPCSAGAPLAAAPRAAAPPAAAPRSAARLRQVQSRKQAQSPAAQRQAAAATPPPRPPPQTAAPQPMARPSKPRQAPPPARPPPLPSAAASQPATAAASPASAGAQEGRYEEGSLLRDLLSMAKRRAAPAAPAAPPTARGQATTPARGFQPAAREEAAARSQAAAPAGPAPALLLAGGGDGALGVGVRSLSEPSLPASRPVVQPAAAPAAAVPAATVAAAAATPASDGARDALAAPAAPLPPPAPLLPPVLVVPPAGGVAGGALSLDDLHRMWALMKQQQQQQQQQAPAPLPSLAVAPPPPPPPPPAAAPAGGDGEPAALPALLPRPPAP